MARSLRGRDGAIEWAARTQGGYFLATGLWPIVHMRSFEAVTGKKADRWLVKCVGALVATIGAGLLGASSQSRLTPELVGIAVASGASLALIESIYVARGRISPVYLFDAAVEAAMVIGWLRAPSMTRKPVE